MKTLSLRDLLRMSSLTRDPEQIRKFHQLRKEAFETADRVYRDREQSYNADHEPTEEMAFGPISLAGELFKRARRMCGLLSPIRPVPLRTTDLNRLLDSSIDMMNYASWFYALIKQAIGEMENGAGMDTPDYIGGKHEPGE